MARTTEPCPSCLGHFSGPNIALMLYLLNSNFCPSCGTHVEDIFCAFHGSVVRAKRQQLILHLLFLASLTPRATGRASSTSAAALPSCSTIRPRTVSPSDPNPPSPEHSGLWPTEISAIERPLLTHSRRRDMIWNIGPLLDLYRRS